MLEIVRELVWMPFDLPPIVNTMKTIRVLPRNMLVSYV